ncbi:MAG: class II aldolase/adducin family protein [candidate division NC10 bacterium]|nr:class II aldolase/adducin family protein [candidate division NC10 bacterium]
MVLGLLSLHAGNLSFRRDDRVFITRTGSRLDHLEAEDIVETPLHPGKPGHPLASMELPAHLAIYATAGVEAIVHAHPPSAIALSFVMDRFIPVDSEGAILLREVPVIRAKRAVASPEVARQAAAHLRDHRIVIVARHGSFAVGRCLEEALSVTTTLEMSAKIMLMVRSLGGAVGLGRVAGGRRR